MKNPTWDDTIPHSDEEIKEGNQPLVRRSGRHDSARQSHERSDRSREETDRSIRRIQQNLNVAEPV